MQIFFSALCLSDEESLEWCSHEVGVGTVQVLSNMFLHFRETETMENEKG